MVVRRLVRMAVTAAVLAAVGAAVRAAIGWVSGEPGTPGIRTSSFDTFPPVPPAPVHRQRRELSRHGRRRHRPGFRAGRRDGHGAHPLWACSADGPVDLFFYPAAMTYGCTKESCHFRDLAKEFADVGAQRVGISADTVEKQKQFSDKHGFDYPLLADPDRKVAGIFGVKGGFGGLVPGQAGHLRHRHRPEGDRRGPQRGLA